MYMYVHTFTYLVGVSGQTINESQYTAQWQGRIQYSVDPLCNIWIVWSLMVLILLRCGDCSTTRHTNMTVELLAQALLYRLDPLR